MTLWLTQREEGVLLEKMRQFIPEGSREEECKKV